MSRPATDVLSRANDWPGSEFANAEFTHARDGDSAAIPLVKLSVGAERAAVPGGHLLGAMHFGAASRQREDEMGPSLHVALPTPGTPSITESWYSQAPVTREIVDGIRLAYSQELLFGTLQLPCTEPDFAANRGYSRILDLIGRAGFPHLLRAWNYFPDINRDQAGLERYRRFCLGRYRAFAEHGSAFDNDLPAASALGTTSGGLQIAFLAARQPGEQVENPRQISAYRYPPRYGPRSPSFSRAMRQRGGERQTLYVSGTASIVGHETVHPDDAEAQCRETLENLRSLYAQAAGQPVSTTQSLDFPAIWKVYIRQIADESRIRAVVEAALGPTARAVYLIADICREDLLVEIEGVAELPPLR